MKKQNQIIKTLGYLPVSYHHVTPGASHATARPATWKSWWCRIHAIRSVSRAIALRGTSQKSRSHPRVIHSANPATARHAAYSSHLTISLAIFLEATFSSSSLRSHQRNFLKREKFRVTRSAYLATTQILKTRKSRKKSSKWRKASSVIISQCKEATMDKKQTKASRSKTQF